MVGALGVAGFLAVAGLALAAFAVAGFAADLVVERRRVVAGLVAADRFAAVAGFAAVARCAAG